MDQQYSRNTIDSNKARERIALITIQPNNSNNNNDDDDGPGVDGPVIHKSTQQNPK